MKKLVILSAGVSTPSTTRMLADQISGAVKSNVSRMGEGLDVEFIEIRDLATDLATLMTTGIPTAAVQAAQDAVSAADGLVAVTPVFAASYSGLFKMFIDALGTDSLNGMSMIIAATAGTPRHSLVLDFALRPLFTHLRAVIMPTGVFAATEDFGGDSGLEGRVARAARELAEQLVTTSSNVAGLPPGAQPPRRTSGTAVDNDVPDFASLLKGHDGN